MAAAGSGASILDRHLRQPIRTPVTQQIDHSDPDRWAWLRSGRVLGGGRVCGRSLQLVAGAGVGVSCVGGRGLQFVARAGVGVSCLGGRGLQFIAGAGVGVSCVSGRGL